MSVDENAAAGTLVGTVIAADLDATAPNNALTYTATGGTGFGLFDIDAATGAVTVKTGAVLDREAAAVTRWRSGRGRRRRLFTTQTLTISLNDLNDNTPSISSSAAMAVDENAAAGTLVGTVSAGDLDATAPNNTMTYTATGGTGFGLFDIDATTGAVTVKSGAVLDREAAASYTLEVKAADAGTPGRFTTQTLTISLNDLDDNTPSISSSAEMAVDENATRRHAGRHGRARSISTRPHRTTRSTYTATGGSGFGLFDINAATGAVTVKAGAVLDREAAASYTLDVKATDGSALFTTQTLTISLNDLNDNTPSISSSAAMAVDENATAGTLVGTGHGERSRRHRAEQCDHLYGDRRDRLRPVRHRCHDRRGDRQIRRRARLRSDAASYTLEVRASDGGTPGRFGTQTLTISLNDLFENALPVITGSTNGTVQRDVSFEIPPDAITNGGFETGLNNFPPDMPGWSFGGCTPRLHPGQRPAFGQRRARHSLRLQFRRTDERDPVGLDRRGRALPAGFLAAQQRHPGPAQQLQRQLGRRGRRQLHRRAGQLHGALGQAQLRADRHRRRRWT